MPIDRQATRRDADREFMHILRGLEVMGWENCHLHRFRFKDKEYGIPDPEYPSEMRNETGLDVALEALRACKRGHTAGMDERWRYAKTCRSRPGAVKCIGRRGTWISMAAANPA